MVEELNIQVPAFTYLAKRPKPTSPTILAVIVSPALFPEKKDARQDSYLYCRTEGKMVKVFLEVIIYIEGMKNYTKVVTSVGTVFSKNSMAAVETMLSNEEFIRVHRSYFIPKGKNKVICRRDDQFRRCGETKWQTIQK